MPHHPRPRGQVSSTWGARHRKRRDYNDLKAAQVTLPLPSQSDGEVTIAQKCPIIALLQNHSTSEASRRVCRQNTHSDAPIQRTGLAGEGGAINYENLSHATHPFWFIYFCQIRNLLNVYNAILVFILDFTGK